MECIICDALNDKSAMVYEDEQVAVFLLNDAFTLGHVKVVPKNHFNIIEQMPDELLSYCMLVANRFASILFETFNLQGTNILIQNGSGAGQKFPHFSIDVIPRKENDGLQLEWQPNKASHESLEGMKNIFIEALENKHEIAEEEPIVKKEEEIDSSNKDNYLINHLKRMP